MNTQSFTDAQQAADAAYEMTLDETGDAAQASDDYKSVMTAYYAAQPDYSRAAFERNVIAKRHGDMTGIGWPLQDMINTVNDTDPLSDLADRMALAYKESELKDYDDWQHINGDCAL